MATGTLPGGTHHLYVQQVDASAEATNHTSTLVRDALARTATKGPIPALICGDQNRTIDEFHCSYALAVGGRQILASTPNCAAAHAHQARRIDLLLANCTLRKPASEVIVDPTQGICTHAWQFGHFFAFF